MKNFLGISQTKWIVIGVFVVLFLLMLLKKIIMGLLFVVVLAVVGWIVYKLKNWGHNHE